MIQIILAILWVATSLLAVLWIVVLLVLLVWYLLIWPLDCWLTTPLETGDEEVANLQVKWYKVRVFPVNGLQMSTGYWLIAATPLEAQINAFCSNLGSDGLLDDFTGDMTKLSENQLALVKSHAEVVECRTDPPLYADFDYQPRWRLIA